MEKFSGDTYARHFPRNFPPFQTLAITPNYSVANWACVFMQFRLFTLIHLHFKIPRESGDPGVICCPMEELLNRVELCLSYAGI